MNTNPTAYLPNVRRRWLLLISAIVWTFAGTILCSRAAIWASELPILGEAILFAGCACVAVVGYRFGFSKIVARNIRRIGTLPEKANVFMFTALRGYLMIGGMISIGVILRSSGIPKIYLAPPYAIMGGVLLIGSVTFLGSFLDASKSDRNRS